jgi:serine/threonine protein kinase
MKLCGASKLEALQLRRSAEFHDVPVEGKKLFVCEPTLDKTLGEFLFPVSGGPQPVAVRWRCMLDIALALRYLHISGIAHGNICASSVWLGRDFTAKVNCSNLYKPTRRQLKCPPPNPRWAAPESLVNDQPEFSIKSDVFALAMLIIQSRIPVGQFPNCGVLQDDQDHILREQAISGELRDLSSVFSDAQASLLYRMCCVDPDGRPSMAEVEEEVRATGFDVKTCQLAASMRSAHDRNIFYGFLPALSAIVHPDSKWDSPSSESEAFKSFSVGLAVLDGIAPELAMGGCPSFSSDVFSLGILISTMVSGQPWREQYRCPAPPLVIGSWMRNNVLPVKPDVFSEVEWELIRRMCAVDPLARASISMVVEELSKIVGNRTGATADETLTWNPTHFEVSSYGISVADALAVANELPLDQENPEYPGTAGARWILRRLQNIDRVLGMDAQPRQVPPVIDCILGETLGSLVKLLMNDDADSSSGSQNFFSNSVSATHGGVHAMHRDIDHLLNELRLPKSALNTRLHDWRQQWELEQYSQVRRIASIESCEQPSLEEPSPEWFWPPYTTTRSSGFLGSGGFGQVHKGR